VKIAVDAWGVVITKIAFWARARRRRQRSDEGGIRHLNVGRKRLGLEYPIASLATTLSQIADHPTPDPPSQPTARPRHAPGIEANEANGRIVLVRPGDGGFHLLDELGTRIWELCDGERSLDQVIAVIGAESDKPPAAVAGDVREWISELRTEALLTD
jgi:hypothetical protein